MQHCPNCGGGELKAESTRSLLAAALPFTQVLAASGAQWRPFRPDDVEQGFWVHAARQREMAERIAARNAVGWSLRVMRGTRARPPST